jgi:AhpD family alkylhydroperoxidase
MEKKIEIKLLPVSIENANDRQKPLLELTHKTYGSYPKMQGIMANMPPLLQSYLEGMAMFRSEGLFTPVEQEIIFMVISLENECIYCLYAHGLIAEKKSGVSVDTIRDIKQKKTLADPKLNSLVVFTKAMIAKKGFATYEDITAFLQAGYTETHILSIIHALSLKIMSNYTNHIFQTEANNVLKKKLLTETV